MAIFRFIARKQLAKIKANAQSRNIQVSNRHTLAPEIKS